MKSNLKLFVWEDVLENYTSGIMFALAESIDDAKDTIIKQYPLMGERSLRMVKEDLEKEPEVYEDKIGFVHFGCD
jgi:hypothetical protein